MGGIELVSGEWLTGALRIFVGHSEGMVLVEAGYQRAMNGVVLVDEYMQRSRERHRPRNLLQRWLWNCQRLEADQLDIVLIAVILALGPAISRRPVCSAAIVTFPRGMCVARDWDRNVHVMG